jgi:hypothetical protein
MVKTLVSILFPVYCSDLEQMHFGDGLSLLPVHGLPTILRDRFIALLDAPSSSSETGCLVWEVESQELAEMADAEEALEIIAAALSVAGYFATGPNLVQIGVTDSHTLSGVYRVATVQGQDPATNRLLGLEDYGDEPSWRNNLAQCARSFADIWKGARKVAVTRERNYPRITNALRLLRVSHFLLSPQVRHLLYTMALECLFLEKSHQPQRELANGVSSFLATSSNEKRELSECMKAIYRLRNRIAHGGTYASHWAIATEDDRLRIRAAWLLRTVLHKLLKEDTLC